MCFYKVICLLAYLPTRFWNACRSDLIRQLDASPPEFTKADMSQSELDSNCRLYVSRWTNLDSEEQSHPLQTPLRWKCYTEHPHSDFHRLTPWPAQRWGTVFRAWTYHNFPTVKTKKSLKTASASSHLRQATHSHCYWGTEVSQLSVIRIQAYHTLINIIRGKSALKFLTNTFAGQTASREQPHDNTQNTHFHLRKVIHAKSYVATFLNST